VIKLALAKEELWLEGASSERFSSAVSSTSVSSGFGSFKLHTTKYLHQTNQKNLNLRTQQTYFQYRVPVHDTARTRYPNPTHSNVFKIMPITTWENTVRAANWAKL
jgi:hypothetical protein